MGKDLVRKKVTFIEKRKQVSRLSETRERVGRHMDHVVC